MFHSSPIQVSGAMFVGLEHVWQAVDSGGTLNPYHAFVSFSGYNAYTPATPGHVFDVTYDPATGKAIWKDISNNLGDAPVTGIAYDRQLSDLYIVTNFGVQLLQIHRTTWVNAAPGLPMVAVYSLSISVSSRVLYAATHGRGHGGSIWISKFSFIK